jgi:aconitate hydratase
VTTDHILPAGARVLPLRSNIPAISEFLFERVSPGFAKRAREAGGGFVVAGENYGQGSSREHAALVPMYLGIKAILARSYARIHRTNLINFGILPLVVRDRQVWARIGESDLLSVRNIRESLKAGRDLVVENVTRGERIEVFLGLNERETGILLAGGLLNETKESEESKS